MTHQRWGRWGVRRRILAWKNVFAFRLHGRGRPSRQASKIAVFKPDRLGDFVLALGAIRWTLERFGEADCVLFISRFAEELAAREFPNTPRVVVPPFADELWPAWKEFELAPKASWWDHGFKTTISLRHQRTPWQELLFGRIRSREKWAVANQALGYHPIERQWISARTTGIVEFPSCDDVSSCQELQAHSRLLRSAFGATEIPAPRLSPPKNLSQNGSLLICPFGSAQIRTLPPRVVAESVAEILARHPMPLRMASLPAEIGRYKEYAAELTQFGLPFPTISTTSSIESLIEEIAASRAVLSTESAGAHLAAALDHPMVGLLGGGHHGIFAPWRRSNLQVWLDHKLDCYHCDWFCSQPEPYCLTRISAKSTAAALSRVLEPVAGW